MGHACAGHVTRIDAWGTPAPGTWRGLTFVVQQMCHKRRFMSHPAKNSLLWHVPRTTNANPRQQQCERAPQASILASNGASVCHKRHFSSALARLAAANETVFLSNCLICLASTHFRCRKARVLIRVRAVCPAVVSRDDCVDDGAHNRDHDGREKRAAKARNPESDAK